MIHLDTKTDGLRKKPFHLTNVVLQRAQGNTAGIARVCLCQQDASGRCFIITRQLGQLAAKALKLQIKSERVHILSE
jgi:hypothetical protein